MARVPSNREPLIAALIGCRWVHSHEEDTADEAVYRPDDYSFPPARGRDGFQLRADGTLVLIMPGAIDRALSQLGRWQLRDNELLVFTDSTGARSRELGWIVAVDSQRLLIRR